MANTKIEMEFDLSKYLKDLSNFLGRKLNGKNFKKTMEEMFIREMQHVHRNYKIGNPAWPEDMWGALYDFAEDQKVYKDHGATKDTYVKIQLGIPGPSKDVWDQYPEGFRYYGLVYTVGIGSNGALHQELRYHKIGEMGWDNSFREQRVVTEETVKNNPMWRPGEKMPEKMNQKGQDREAFIANVSTRIDVLFNYLATEVWLPEFYGDSKYQLVNYIKPIVKG